MLTSGADNKKVPPASRARYGLESVPSSAVLPREINNSPDRQEGARPWPGRHQRQPGVEEDVGLAGGEAEAEQENTAQISRDHPVDKQGSGNQPGDRKYSTFM